MDGNELRTRLDKLQVTYRDAARNLGLSEPGLHLQMRGLRRVSRQTELLLNVLESRLRSFASVAAASTVARTPVKQPRIRTYVVGSVVNIDQEASSLRNAIHDLDDFVHRHKGVDPDLERFARTLRMRLLQRLDGAEVHHFDTARHRRQPKLEVIEPKPE